MTAKKKDPKVARARSTKKRLPSAANQEETDQAEARWNRILAEDSFTSLEDIE